MSWLLFVVFAGAIAFAFGWIEFSREAAAYRKQNDMDADRKSQCVTQLGRRFVNILLGRDRAEFTTLSPKLALGGQPSEHVREQLEQARQWMRDNGIKPLSDGSTPSQDDLAEH